MKKENLSPKEDRLLKYLKKKKGGDITSLEAINKLGDTRLSATIYLLRRRGYCILDEYKTSTNRYGDEVKYKRYMFNESINK